MRTVVKGVIVRGECAFECSSLALNDCESLSGGKVRLRELGWWGVPCILISYIANAAVFGDIYGKGFMVSEFDLTHASDRQLTNYRRTGTGFILQYYNLLPNLTVLENV